MTREQAQELIERILVHEVGAPRNAEVARLVVGGLTAAGYAVVPLVPTEAMVEAAHRANDEKGGAWPDEVWTAMIAAAGDAE